MGRPIASKTRKQLRQTIGYHLGSILVSTCSEEGLATTIVDDVGLAWGGDDDFKGAEVIMISGTTTNIGLKRRVTLFTATSDTLTIPYLTSITADGDGYELHENYLIDEIHSSINQAIVAATDDILVDKDDDSLVKQEGIYEYAVPTGFVAIHNVEYVSSYGIDRLIHDCNTVWDELVDTDVTATADTTEGNHKEGSASLKLVVADACAAGDILATEDITELDMSDCDKVTLWVYSSVALDSGDVQVLLGDTAQCASAVESLDIPDITADTWTRCVISLTNPSSDSAIISVGLKMIVDKDAFTLRVDDIRAVKATSRIYKRLNPDFWTIVLGTTDYLKINQDGYDTITNNRRLRLLGYQIPAELSDDTTALTIDPDYVIARAMALLLGSRTGVEAQANFWMAISEKKLMEARTNYAPNTRYV